MKSKLSFRAGVSLVEVMVAMLVLSIGLLGMAMMTAMVMKTNRSASLTSSATNLCQLKIEELKNVAQATGGWASLGTILDSGTSDDKLEFGREKAKLAQETNLNELGNTKASQLDSESGNGGPCSSYAVGTPLSSVNEACMDHLNSRGPYVFTRTFIVCNGEDYNSGPVYKYPDATMTSTLQAAVSAAEASASRGSISLDCNVNPDNDPATRSQWLTCNPSDISSTPGTGNPEKKVKVLCAWRARNADCHSVHLDTTITNLN